MTTPNDGSVDGQSMIPPPSDASQNGSDRGRHGRNGAGRGCGGRGNIRDRNKKKAELPRCTAITKFKGNMEGMKRDNRQAT